MRRRLLVVLLVALCAVGVAVASERHHPVHALTAQPNILLVITDDQRFDSLPGMSYLNGSPNGHWVKFQNAFANTPLCCPTRATLLTGQYAHHHGVEHNARAHILDDASLLPVWMSAAGYRTGLIGKYFNTYPFGEPLYEPPGWSEWFSLQGYYNYEVYENGNPPYTAGNTAADYSTTVLTNRAKAFLASSPASQPFFLYLAYAAPHSQYKPAPQYANAAVTVPPNRGGFNEEKVADKPKHVRDRPKYTTYQGNQLRADRANQYRTMKSVDDGMQELINALQTSGRLDNTVIIFMSDNGYLFGEHRLDRKLVPYEESVRVPLLVRYPSGPTAKRTLTQLVSTVDIAATLNDLANTNPTRNQNGRSIKSLLDGSSAWPNKVLLHWGGGGTFGEPATDPAFVPGYFGIRTPQWKYIEYETGEKELYDMKNDQFELTNQANNPKYINTRNELKSQLQALK